MVADPKGSYFLKHKVYLKEQKNKSDAHASWMPGEEIRTWHGHVHEETYFSEKIYYLFRNISKLDENYIKLAEKVIKSCNFASQQNLRRHCKQTKWGNLKSLSTR